MLARPLLACSHLSAADLMSASRVGRHWRAFLAGEDSLWQRLCAADWALPGPEAPDRSPLPSYRAAYAAWHVVYGRYGELGRRAAAAWRRAEDWTAAHLPPVAVSLRWAAAVRPARAAPLAASRTAARRGWHPQRLADSQPRPACCAWSVRRPGASAEELHDAGTALGVALPPALCALYAGHDGQVLEFDRRVDAQRTAMHDSLFHGLFGGWAGAAGRRRRARSCRRLGCTASWAASLRLWQPPIWPACRAAPPRTACCAAALEPRRYSFYSHMVSTRMLPLKRMVLWTRRLRQRLPPGALGAK